MFVGRENELSQLEVMYQENRFHMVIVYGRRRVGKTTLIRHFIQNKRALIFSAEEVSESFNLQLFAKKLREFFNIPPMIPNFTTWREALEYVSYMAKKECFYFSFG
ncbi:MAG: ATP-binding protein [Lactobacillales bacterium]|jgi:AAA+ ATPase superfamily predicted ATPase|nr:ATP-binding protein [Lactobacillales bacterium]